MIEKEIEIEGKKYYKNRRIKSESTMYIEYRNDKLQKIKFFELKNGAICEVEDKEKLKKAIKKIYNIYEEVVE
jgi:hypothetical protein